METTDINQPETVMKAICALSKKLSKSQLKQTKLKGASLNIKKLESYLNVSKNEVLVFTAIFELQLEGTRHLDISDICGYFDLTYLEILEYLPDFEKLIDKNLVELEGNRHDKSELPLQAFFFSIPDYVVKGILMNEPFSGYSPTKLTDIYSFVKKISDLIEHRILADSSTFELFRAVEKLENINMHLGVIDELNCMQLAIEDKTLLYDICDDLLSCVPTDLGDTLNDIYDSRKQKHRIMLMFKEGQGRLFDLNLINIKETNFMQNSQLELTSKGVNLFLKEDANLYLKKTGAHTMISADKIKQKQLFYGDRLGKEISFLTNSLQGVSFTDLQQRLEQHSLPKGIAVILYGLPGTGKTETVYQLAKQTGRSIMHVDISQTKSMWFGESEKKIKEVFTEYARVCEGSELKPILLFNEADAVFGKRKDANSSNVAQTENAMQNIILEELEKLDGILIATTNLNQNLDAAFERRFLFKIRFDNPDLYAKQKIWQNKLEWLSDTDSLRMAEYSFSGGEIDNISRKAIMDEVLTGRKPTIEKLLDYCNMEKFSDAGHRKLGFT